MQLQSLSRRYTVRQLMETDVDAMLALCSGNPQFYHYHPPMATKASILDDLQAVPPGKTLSDKYFIGFYDGETLAAMMDLITGYPQPGHRIHRPIYGGCCPAGQWYRQRTDCRLQAGIAGRTIQNTAPCHRRGQPPKQSLLAEKRFCVDRPAHPERKWRLPAHGV